LEVEIESRKILDEEMKENYEMELVEKEEEGLYRLEVERVKYN